MNGGIAVAYSGVHQAYQLALAAQELGRLDRFYCSMFAAEGKWGGVFARLMGSDALVNRRVDGLSSKRVCENPWPLLTHRLRTRFRPASANDWTLANEWFDSMGGAPHQTERLPHLRGRRNLFGGVARRGPRMRQGSCA